jgi:hypothetical protein
VSLPAIKCKGSPECDPGRQTRLHDLARRHVAYEHPPYGRGELIRWARLEGLRGRSAFCCSFMPQLFSQMQSQEKTPGARQWHLAC